jgi:hypothetical protein
MIRAYSWFWRSVVVGVGYAATLSLTNMLLGRSVALRSIIWLFAGGTAIGLMLGPLARYMAATWERHLLVWRSIVFFNIASVAVEGRIYAPGLLQGPLGGVLLQQLAVSLITALLIVELFASNAALAPGLSIRWSWFSWIWRFVVSALSYVAFYYFFGAISYLLITGPYYKAHAGGLVTPPPGVILGAELIRGPLIVLSVLPFLLSFQASARRTRILTGIILFAVGGLAPLLMNVGILPWVVLAGSAVEIFCQNFSAGVVTARLIGRPERGAFGAATDASLAHSFPRK